MSSELRGKRASAGSRRQGQGEALRALVQQLQALIQSSPLAIVSLDPAGRVTSWNPAAERILGWTAAEAMGQELPMVPPANRGTVRRVLDQVLAGRSLTRVGVDGVRRDGTPADLRVSAAPLHGPDGDVTGIIAMADDVTEWREALAASESLNRAILRSLAAHIAVIDRNGLVIAANDAWEKLGHESNPFVLGHPGVGSNYLQVLRAADGHLKDQARTTLAGIQAVLAGRRRSFRCEFSYPSPAGRRWYTVSITPLQGGGGAVISHEDVTEHKQARESEALLREVDSRILRSQPLDQILEFICSRLTDMLGLAVAYISLKEPDYQVRVRAASGPAAGFLEGLTIRWDDSSEGSGPSGVAIRTGRPHMGDAQADPGSAAWQERARAFGLRSFLSIPLLAEETAIGALCLCSSSPRAFAGWASGYLAGLANQVAVSIQAAGHHEQIQLLTAALESAANAVVIADRGGVIKWVNPAFYRLTGYAADEVIGATPRLFSSGKHPDAFYRQMWETILSGQTWRGEVQNRRKGGSLYTEDMTITPVRDDGGSISHFIAIKQDITERMIQEQQIRHLAMHDPLTNLPNRRVLQETLERVVDRAGRGHHGALLLMDLDDFKLVNDTLGHLAGDQLLVTLAEVLKRSLRPGDMLARLGGDEFAALVEDVSLDEAQAIAERLRVAADAHRFEHDGYACDPAVSIGICPIDGSLDPAAVLRLADRALYGAKDLGKNRVVVYQAGDGGSADLAVAGQWISRIKDALRLDRLALHFQPIVRLATGEVEHYEVLVRMVDQGGEIIGPGQFLPIAERFGLMSQVDRWVVGQVLDLLEARPDLRLFVNLSGASLGDELLLSHIEERVRQSRLGSGRLTFEITETAAVTDVHRAQQWMRRLTAVGCRFALDDFGVGFSSFWYLKMLPADSVKIEGSFVSHLHTDPSSRAIVQAMTAVAHALGKEVIAEWVETAETAALLRAMGVEHGQGFFWGGPAPQPTVEPAQAPPPAQRKGARRRSARRT